MTTTSINFHLRPSTRAGHHQGRLFIRIIHAREIRHLSTDFSLYDEEWDTKTHEIVFPPDDSERHYRLSLIRDSMERSMNYLRGVVSYLSEKGDYSASDVVWRFRALQNRTTLYGYAEVVANKLRESGRERTARAYRSAVRSLTLFNGGRETVLSELTPTLVKAYEQHLFGNGLRLNTISFYLRNLRALYFRAIREKLIVKQAENPFAGTHTGVYETRRRALSVSQLKTLAALEELLSEELTEKKDSASAGGFRSEAELSSASLRKAVDEHCRTMPEVHDSLLYFLFCYHARGMSFVDMAYLKKQDVGKDIFSYRRRKTGGLLEVKITKPMRRILKHFSRRKTDSDYAFPVITSSDRNTWRQYESGLKKQNRLLKELAKMANITDRLSTHVARHTWATTAKRMNIPLALIGEALGHRDTKTTSIYLASFDRETMDKLSVKVSAAASSRNLERGIQLSCN